MIQLILLLGLLYWIVHALPYVISAAVAIWWVHAALGAWVDKPLPIAPEIRFVPMYPDMPQQWNWTVHMYLLDEIDVYELLNRA